MSESVIRSLIIFSIGLYLPAVLYLYANDYESNLSMQSVSPDAKSKDFIFLPQAGLQIEGKLFAGNEADYKMETQRIIDLDIFRIRNFVFSMSVNEILTFKNSSSNHVYPKLIDYEMNFGSLSLEYEYGILSLFFDHKCTNIFNENETEDRRLRWYGSGIRWESYGMKPGQKNINHEKPTNIDIINNLNYRISIDKSIHTRIFNYNCLIFGTLRYDIFTYYFLIPYIEGSFTALIDNRIRFNRYYESGIRMHFDKGDITPFLGINHKHDIDYYNGIETDLYYVGLRMETLLGNTDGAKEKIGEAFFPDFHFSCSYGKYINNDIINFNTDILMGIDFLRSFKKSPFMNYRLSHNSLSKHFGLYPRYIHHNIEAGISYWMNFLNALIEPYYRYIRYDEGNFYNGFTEQVHMAVFRIRNIEMKTGYANKGMEFNNTSLKWINRMDWLISAGRTFKENHYNYIWEYNLMLRWNSFCLYKSIPYISAGINFLKNDSYDEIYCLEPGIRIQSGLYWMLFYRYEYRTAIDPDNGIYSNYHLIGIRIEM